jgi:hypothetical protein
MGFFSWNCKACGHPLLSPQATEDKNKWMTKGVALTPDGSTIIGDYDGYGCLGSYDYNDDGEAEMYHHACWALAGMPREFKEVSEDARDQGWFFDNNIHNVTEPQSQDDLHNIKIAGDLAQKLSCSSWKSAHLGYLISVAWDLINDEIKDPKEKERAMENLQRHIDQEKKEEDDRAKEEEAKKEKEEKEDRDEMRAYHENLGEFYCEKCGLLFPLEKRIVQDDMWICKDGCK